MKPNYIKKPIFINSITVIIAFLIVYCIVIQTNKSSYLKGQTHGVITGAKHGYDSGFSKALKFRFSGLYRLDSTVKAVNDKFLPHVNYARIVESVASVGTINERQSKEVFSKHLDSINKELISILAKTMDMTDADKQMFLNSYKTVSHAYNSSAFNELVYLNSKEVVVKEPIIFTSRNYNYVVNYEKVLASSICRMVSLLSANLTDAPESSTLISWGSSEICKFISTEMLKHFIQKLREQAIIKDYEETRITLNKQVSKGILQLATAETNSVKTYDKNYGSIITLFGPDFSLAKIVIKASSVTKAGFNLEKSFALNIYPDKKQIEIVLPEPEIISHEVHPTLETIKNSWFEKIDKDKINIGMAAITADLKEAAIRSPLRGLAKNNAETLLRVIFQPIAYLSPEPYDVILRIGKYDQRKLLTFSNLSQKRN